MSNEIELRAYQENDDVVAIADLFFESIHAIDDAIYSPEQKTVWAPEPPKYEYWATHVKPSKTLLAFKEDKLVGFMELEINELDRSGYIDCFYVHPKFQGQGVGKALYQATLSRAQKHQLTTLYVDASLVARPVFERQGFTVMKENQVVRQGISLTNFSMEKSLA